MRTLSKELAKASTLTTAKLPPRHFLDIADLDSKTLRRIVDMAHAMKRAGKRVPAEFRPKGIEDCVLLLIFEKPSTRTRVSFDIANAPAWRRGVDAQSYGSAVGSR